MLFYQKTFKCFKKDLFFYQLIIQTASKNIWLNFIKKFKFLQFSSLPIKIKKYFFIKSPHKYSTSKRQIISKIFSYKNILFLKKKEFFYFRFFLLYFPPGLIIILNKKI
jgi:hypothetical protein